MVDIVERTKTASNVVVDITIAGFGAFGGTYVASKGGKLIEGALVKPVTPSSSSTSKLTAWFVNNAPKFGAAWLAEKYAKKNIPEGSNERRLIDSFAYGIAGDIILDTYERLINKRAQPIPTIGNIVPSDSRIQALLNENVSLKQAIAALNQNIKLLHNTKTAQEVPYREPLIPYSETPYSDSVPYVEASNLPSTITAHETGEVHGSEEKYHFANAQAPSPTERKFRFAAEEIVKPEVLVTQFGFTRGE